MRCNRGRGGAALFVAALALSAADCSDPATDLPPPAVTPPGDGTLGTRSVASGLLRPVLVAAPVGDERIFVVEQGGTIRIVEADVVRARPFLDLSGLIVAGGERGLLGLAFAPDYGVSGLFYVNYSNISGDTVIARYRVGANPDVADASSAEVLLAVPQPFTNHNGGSLAFGADGFLYIGLGDGGSAGDPGNRAQDDGTMLGKMLRIDVGGGLGSGYAVPVSNPFAGGVLPLPEIWAKGLRNPYRFSFDRVMGDLYIADVGQNQREEVSIEAFGVPGGRNYGWRLMEGKICFNPASNCDDGSLTLPVVEYDHGQGRCSVTGGYVYRGSIAEIFGHYFYADFCSGEVFSFAWDGTADVPAVIGRTAMLAPPGGFQSVTGFGEDGAGELYIVQFGPGDNTGEVFKIVSES